MRLQSSINEVSLPDINLSACNATAGNGGRPSRSHCISMESLALDVPVA
jgi:hypothetical protein